MATPVRLQRYLAAAGVAARRKAEELITAGRVMVNGKPVTTLGSKVDPASDRVTVDGQAVYPLDHFYVVFNKPKACITAVTDDRGRVTVMDFLPNLPAPVKPVGRLDYYTEGVLLLTNDGELAAKLLAPSSHVPKTYHVKVHGQMRPEQVKLLKNGVQLDDGTTTLPAEVEVLPGESKHTWLAITIHEGKHRQIHRMIEALGYYVDKLQRVAFANLTFHHLRVGDARELVQQELNELRDLVGLDHSATTRGKWRSSREDTDIPRRARAKAQAEAEAAALEAGAPPQDAGADDTEDAWEWQGSGQVKPQSQYGAAARDAGPGSAGRPDDRGGPSRNTRGSDDRGGPSRNARGSGDRGGPSRNARGSADRSGPSGASRNARGSADRSGPSGASRNARGSADRSGPSRNARGSADRSGPGRSVRSSDDRGGLGRNTRAWADRSGSGGGGGGGARSGGPGGGGARSGGRGFGAQRRDDAGPRSGGPRGFGTQSAPSGSRANRDRAEGEEGAPKRGGQGRTFGKRVGAPSGERRGGPGGPGARGGSDRRGPSAGPAGRASDRRGPSAGPARGAGDRRGPSAGPGRGANDRRGPSGGSGGRPSADRRGPSSSRGGRPSTSRGGQSSGGRRGPRR